MASKFGLAGGIPERRVRPIWDAVDSRQFKHAHKLCAALLAKFPSSPYALALKALISERMGKTDEALAVCLDAKEKLFSQNAILIDDLTLSTLQIVFQRLDRLDLATSCYEHACGKYPNNLEIIMGLFNCYVREYSFVKQQQTAIKMYKIVGEERFLLWAVCSIQLQVFCSNGGEKLLSLAEALLKKHISSHSLHEPEALVIYISVLEQQAKYRDALEILSGDLGSLITIEADKLRIQGRLLARACDYAAAADIFQKVLESCPDDWESFLHYLGCLLEEDMNWPSQMAKDQIYSSNSIDSLACKGSHLIEEVFDERISSALSFVEKLQSTVSTDFVRCPYLATIEIERRRRLKGKADDGKLLEALLDYFHRFSHLSNFTSDVEIYLRLLTDSEKASVLENFVQNSQSTLTSPLKTLGQAITVFKVQEVLGVNMTLPVIELEGTALRMVEMYCKNLPLSRDLDPQENMHGEELLSMASGVLVLLFWRTRSLGYLLEAILVLEFGLTIRCNVWQYKILLLHLYSYIGALPLAYEWYGTLDVKNILLESVSHHIVPHMLRSPFWSETADLLREYLKFMDDYLREAADLTFLAYRHRNYSKVIEFVQFKERLQHSNQYLMARLEASVLQLKEKADNLEEVESILESVNNGTQLLELSNEEKLKSITFNEDLQSRPWWSPASNVNYLSEPFDGGSLCRENSHKLDKKEGNTRKLIERKSLLPRLVYLSVHTSPSFLKEAVVSNGSIPDSNSSQLKNLLERCASNLGFTFNDALRFIDEVARGQKPFKAFGSDVLDWVNFAIFVNAWNSGSYHSTPPSGVGCNSSSWCVVDNLVKTSIIDQLTHAQPVLTTPGSNFPILVQLVSESFSWHILVIQSCVRSMVPQGKKKKKSNTLNSPNVPHGQAARASIECLINAIQEVCRWLGGQVNSSEDENLDVLFSHVQNKEHEEGPGHVLQLLQENASVDNSDLGERISGAMQSWSSPTVVRKLIEVQKYQLSKFHLICASKLKILETLKQSILG